MRADLLALTPESLAVLTNLGLLKRAQKEIVSGAGPAVSEEADGTVSGKFPGGVETRLSPRRSLAEGQCSCGASSTCRHLVATVLVYLQHPPQESRQTEPAEPHSASELEAILKAYLGPRLYQRARRLAASTRAQVESPTLVHLETCTVRFLSGLRLDFARCDCSAAAPCEHLALALWALRGELAPVDTQEVSLQALGPALQLVQEVLQGGVARTGPGLTSRFQEAHRELLRQGMVWPAQLLSEIEAELGYYWSRNGRYRAGRVAQSAASLWARREVSLLGGPNASEALGLSQAAETSLRQVRLTGLGCRVERDETQYFLAEATSGRVLVLSLPTGHDPAGLSPTALAAGHLVTAAAHRQANGLLRLGRGPHSVSSCSSWKHLGSLCGPPALPGGALLGECHAAPDLRVLRVAEVSGAFYSPGQQELSVLISTPEGAQARLALSHRAATPFALECLWEARERLVAVAGPMEVEGRRWRMRPTALLVGDTVEVPDLAEEGALEGAPLAQVAQPEDPLAAAVQEGLSCWHEAVHRGLGRGGHRALAAASRLREVGMSRTAEQFEVAVQAEDWLRLGARLQTAQALLLRPPEQL